MLTALLLDIIARLQPLTVEGSLEHHYVVSMAGEVLSHLVGSETEIDTSGVANEMLHDAITLHNHPGLPFPPSENDIVNALACGERATFVVNAAGVGRLQTRWPAVGAEDRFRALLDAAQTLETRAGHRLGWYGGKRVPQRLFTRWPAAAEDEIWDLAMAYPEFVDYAFVSGAAAPAELRALVTL